LSIPLSREELRKDHGLLEKFNRGVRGIVDCMLL